MAASTDDIAVAVAGATSHLYAIPKSTGFLGSPVSVTGPVTALAADKVWGVFAALSGSMYSWPWMSSTPKLVATDTNIVTTELGVFTFTGGSELCFLNGQTQGSGGGVYCEPLFGAGPPSLAIQLDVGAGLSGDGTNVYSVYKGQDPGFGIAHEWTIGGTDTFIPGTFADTTADIAVDGATTYWLAKEGGAVFTHPTAGATAFAQLMPALAGATRIKVVGRYVYLMSPNQISRFDKTSAGALESIVNETTTITGFDVDAQGVYWAIAGVVKLRGLSSQ